MENTTVEIGIEIQPSAISKYLEVNLTETTDTPLQIIDNYFRKCLYEQVICRLGNELVSEPKIKVHEFYHKNKCLSLKGLEKEGYDNWYMEIHTKLSKTSPIHFLDINPIGFDLNYQGVHAGVYNYEKNLKTQRNIRTVLNHVFVPASIFKDISEISSFKNIGLMADLNKITPDRLKLLPIFVDKVTGDEFYCSCAIGVAKQCGGLIENIGVKDNICHLCIAEKKGLEAVSKHYGEEHIVNHRAYIYQIELQNGVPWATARALVYEKLGISKWKSEALLYMLIKQLFPGELVYREYSPDWLERQRIDIYIPSVRLAIEYQGEQHYQAVQVFGGAASLAKTQQRDERKMVLCKKNGVKLEHYKFTEPITIDYLKNKFKQFLK